MFYGMTFVFVLLIAAPLIVHTMGADKSFLKSLRGQIGVNADTPIKALLQPLDAGLNDTKSYYTGSGLPKGYSEHLSASPLPVTTGNYNDLRKLF